MKENAKSIFSIPLNSLKRITLLSLFFVVAACDNPLGDMSQANSSVNTSLSFSGIDSIDGITDSTANLHWSHATGVSVYQIFEVTNNGLLYVDSVNAPGDTYLLTGLSSDQQYTYWVRAFDSKGDSDSNTRNVSFTTNFSPASPSGLTLSSPAVSPGFDDTPTILVSGVKDGDTVGLFTDSNCSTQVGTAVSSGTTVEVTTNPLAPSIYTFYAQASRENASDCSTVSVTYESTACPLGYIPVPADPSVGANNNFCVMQYEAKAWNDANFNDVVDPGEVDADGCGEGACSTGNWASIPTYKPISQEDELPWRRISQDQARVACDALNEVGETNFALISNPEWMAISRNIEAQDDNWTGPTVGSGLLFQGNNGSDTGSSYNGSDPEGGAGRDTKAMHILSNGEEIWDISGNVWDWVDWNVTPANKAYDSGDGSPQSAWREWTSIDTLIGALDEMYPESWQPFNPAYNSAQGVGQYYAGSNASGGAALRGGNWSNGTLAGVFALALSNSSTVTFTHIGFRCVYRP